MNWKMGLAILASTAALLVGCGGGSSGASALPGGSSGGSTGGTTQPDTLKSVIVTLTATDPTSGASSTSLVYGKPARLQAKVTDQDGKVVPSAIVTFTATPDGLVDFSQTSVLTNAQGIAEVQVSARIISTPSAVSLTAAVSAANVTGTSLPVNMSVGSTTSSGTVGAPAILQYVSTSPTRIVIKGASVGAAGTVSENSTVSFKVLDSAGNTVSGAQVTFDVSTRNGGVTTNSSASAVTVTSNSLGVAEVTVGSGTEPESLYVFATLPGSSDPTRRFYANDQIAISSGLPDQYFFTLFHQAGSACSDPSKPLVYPCGMTINVADILGHPAPDGTIVSFATMEGGLVVGDADGNANATGYCLTKAGQCNVNVWGGGSRTADLVNGPFANEVVAYAIGQRAPANTPIDVLSRLSATPKVIVAAPASDNYVRDYIHW